MPAVQDFYDQDFQSDGVDVLGIAISAPESDIQAFVDKAGLTFQMTYDPYGELSAAYGVTGVPNYFFLDRSGRVADSLLGAPYEVEVIRTKIRELQTQ